MSIATYFRLCTYWLITRILSKVAGAFVVNSCTFAAISGVTSSVPALRAVCQRDTSAQDWNVLIGTLVDGMKFTASLGTSPLQCGPNCSVLWNGRSFISQM